MTDNFYDGKNVFERTNNKKKKLKPYFGFSLAFMGQASTLTYYFTYMISHKNFSHLQ